MQNTQAFVALGRAKNKAAEQDKDIKELGKRNEAELDSNGGNIAKLENKLYDEFWKNISQTLYINSLNDRASRDGEGDGSSSLSREGSSSLSGTAKLNTTGTHGHSLDQQNLFVLHPENPYKVGWDMVVGIFVIYSVMVIPFRVGFPIPPTAGSITVDILIDIVFGIDMLFNFNTSYFDLKNDTFEFSRTKIARKYLEFWFYVDFVSIFPFGLLIDSGDQNATMFKSVRLIRLLRLAKLYRLNSWITYLEKSNVSPSTVHLSILIAQVLFLCHLFACLWHYLALDKTFSWLTVFEAECSEGANCVSIYSQYVASLYYCTVTLLTIGYGDIYPVTNGERGFAIVLMMTGGVVFGAMLSKVALTIDKRNPRAKAFQEKIGEFKAFIDDKSLPLHLKLEAKEAYAYYLSKKSTFGEAKILKDIPVPILKSMVYKFYEEDIEKIRLFSKCNYDSSFVIFLVQHMRPWQAKRSEVLYREGDVCNEVGFISEGCVSISNLLQEGNVVTGYSTQGNYFGDFELFKNSCCLATYTAVRSCALLSVDHRTMTRASNITLATQTKFTSDITSRYRTFNKALQGNYEKVDMGKLAGKGRNIRSLSTMTNFILNAKKSFRNALNSSAKKNQPKISSLISPGYESPPRITRSRTSDILSRENVWVDGKVMSRDQIEHLINEIIANENNVDIDKVKIMVLALAHDDDDSDEDEEKEEGENPNEVEVEDVWVEEIVQNTYLWQRGIINPMDATKIYFDIFIAALIVTSVLVVPVNIAFEATALNEMSIEIISTIFFGFDMLASMRTAVFDSTHTDALIIDPHHILAKYLKTWFIVDFASTVPMDLIMQGVSDNPATKSNKLIKILRVFRLLKLTRVLKLGVYIEVVEDSLGVSPAVFDLAKLGIQVYIVCHFVACFWWGMCRIMSTNTWYTACASECYITNPGSEYPEEECLCAQDPTPGYEYVVTLYWTIATITSVGYGEIHPVNSSERLVAILIILFGASIFGFMIAKVTQAMDSFNKAETIKADRLDGIKEYLKEKECPTYLGEKVINHFRSLFHIQSAFDEDMILACLPKRLKDEILLRTHKRSMEQISMFNYIKNTSIKLYLLDMMNPVFYQKGQSLLLEGSKGWSLQFLIIGNAVVVKKLPEVFKNKITTHMASKLMSWKNRAVEKKKARRSLAKIHPMVSEEGSEFSMEDSSLSSKSFLGSSKKAKSFSPTTSFTKVFSTMLNNAKHETSLERDSENFVLFSDWHNKAEMSRRRLELTGELNAGDAVGHQGLMFGRSCGTVVATATTQTYELTKTQIASLIRVEPTVAIPFQIALGASIAEQSKRNKKQFQRKTFNEFKADIRSKYYHSQGMRDQVTDEDRSFKYRAFKVIPMLFRGKTISSLVREKQSNLRPYEPNEKLEKVLWTVKPKDFEDDEEVSQRLMSSITSSRTSSSMSFGNKDSSKDDIFMVTKFDNEGLSISSDKSADFRKIRPLVRHNSSGRAYGNSSIERAQKTATRKQRATFPPPDYKTDEMTSWMQQMI